MSASDQKTTASASNGDTAPPSVDASTRRALLRTPRPPIYRGQPYTAILAFLAAMSVYWVWRVEGKGLAGQDLMTRWVFYSIIVIGFYLVFGISGQFAFSQAAFAGLG